MSKKYRIGVVGLTHDHVWGVLENLVASENGILAAVADPHQPLLDKVQQKHACACYLDYKEMAAKEPLDAAFVFCDNAQGAEVSIWAAQRGLQVMVEKPMAATLDGAERMMAAVQKAGVRMMVNWPVVWRPQVQAALAFASRPEFGKVWQLTHRAAHGGPEVECTPYFREWIIDPRRNGAGALVDLCCYGINMAQVLLGKPDRVTAVVGQLQRTDLVVEDNAVVVMSYPHAMATAEGSWGQIGHPVAGYLATIWGTRGSVTFGPGRGGRIWTTSEGQENVEITPPQPEPHMSSGAVHFLWALATGSEFHPLCQPTTCRDTQEVLEAAKLAAQQGTSVALPLGVKGRACGCSGGGQG